MKFPEGIDHFLGNTFPLNLIYFLRRGRYYLSTSLRILLKHFVEARGIRRAHAMNLFLGSLGFRIPRLPLPMHV